MKLKFKMTNGRKNMMNIVAHLGAKLGVAFWMPNFKKKYYIKPSFNIQNTVVLYVIP